MVVVEEVWPLGVMPMSSVKTLYPKRVALEMFEAGTLGRLMMHSTIFMSMFLFAFSSIILSF